MDKLLEQLNKEFNYCKYVSFEPFPSISPKFFAGYRIYCEKLNKYIDSSTDCQNCEYKTIGD